LYRSSPITDGETPNPDLCIAGWKKKSIWEWVMRNTQKKNKSDPIGQKLKVKTKKTYVTLKGETG